MTRPRRAMPLSPAWQAVWITEILIIGLLVGVVIGSVIALQQ